MSFLGKVSCNVDKLVTGSWEEIILDYQVGASGIADGAWIKATFKFYSDWALFQTSNPTAANYVSSEYQAKVKVLLRYNPSRCAVIKKDMNGLIKKP